MDPDNFRIFGFSTRDRYERHLAGVAKRIAERTGSALAAFDRIFVINLAHRTDRWESIVRQMEYLRVTNYERFDAIAPQFGDLALADYKNSRYYQREGSDTSTKKRVLAGKVGCRRSHLGCLKLAQERGYRSVLILEDDVLLNPAINSKLDRIMAQAPEGWDLLYLGGNYLQHDDARPWCAIQRSNSTYAYAVHQRAYDVIIAGLETCATEVDRYYYRIQKKGRVWGANPRLIKHMEGFSDIEQRVYNFTG